jgi:hypothetical protein
MSVFLLSVWSEGRIWKHQQRIVLQTGTRALVFSLCPGQLANELLLPQWLPLLFFLEIRAIPQWGLLMPFPPWPDCPWVNWKCGPLERGTNNREAFNLMLATFREILGTCWCWISFEAVPGHNEAKFSLQCSCFCIFIFFQNQPNVSAECL